MLNSHTTKPYKTGYLCQTETEEHYIRKGIDLIWGWAELIFVLRLVIFISVSLRFLSQGLKYGEVLGWGLNPSEEMRAPHNNAFWNKSHHGTILYILKYKKEKKNSHYLLNSILDYSDIFPRGLSGYWDYSAFWYILKLFEIQITMTKQLSKSSISAA